MSIDEYYLMLQFNKILVIVLVPCEFQWNFVKASNLLQQMDKHTF